MTAAWAGGRVGRTGSLLMLLRSQSADGPPDTGEIWLPRSTEGPGRDGLRQTSASATQTLQVLPFPPAMRVRERAPRRLQKPLGASDCSSKSGAQSTRLTHSSPL